VKRQEEAKALRKVREATEHKHASGGNSPQGLSSGAPSTQNAAPSSEQERGQSPDNGACCGETTVDQTFAKDSGTDRPEMTHNGSSPQELPQRALPLHHVLHQLQEALRGYVDQRQEPHVFSMESELGHNTLFVVFDSTLSQPKDVTALPAQCPGWGLHNASAEICHTCAYKARCEEAQTVIKTEDTLII